MINETQIDLLAKWASQNIYARCLWAFGSRIYGSPRKNSDLDIAIAVEKQEYSSEWSAYTFGKNDWERDLQRHFHWKVSFFFYGIPPPPANPKYGHEVMMEIDKKGLLLYGNDENKVSQPN